jgi:hypothetical protein
VDHLAEDEAEVQRWRLSFEVGVVGILLEPASELVGMSGGVRVAVGFEHRRLLHGPNQLSARPVKWMGRHVHDRHRRSLPSRAATLCPGLARERNHAKQTHTAFPGLEPERAASFAPVRGWRDLAVSTFVVGPFVFQVFSAIAALGTTILERTFPPGTHIGRLWPIQEPTIWRHQPGLGAAEVVAFTEQIPASLRGSLVLSSATVSP